MIFILIIVLAVAGIITGIIMHLKDDYGAGSAVGFMSFLFGGVAVMVVAMVASLTSAATTVETGSERVTLTALSTSNSSTTVTNYFLGSSTVDGVKSLNYITEVEDGDGTWSSVESAAADDSRIFQDEAGAPYVVITTFVGRSPILVPFSLSDSVTYDFHVPEDSVVSDFSVDIQK
jgi:hypothetical protein